MHEKGFGPVQLYVPSCFSYNVFYQEESNYEMVGRV